MDAPSQFKGLHGGPPRRISQVPQIDPPEAEKRAISGWKLATAAHGSAMGMVHALILGLVGAALVATCRIKKAA